MRSYYSPHWIFSLLSPSLFHLSIVFLDKNAFRRAPHFRQRIFIVNRFLPSRSFQSSLSPLPLLLCLFIVLWNSARRHFYRFPSLPVDFHLSKLHWFMAMLPRLFHRFETSSIVVYPYRRAQLHHAAKIRWNGFRNDRFFFFFSSEKYLTRHFFFTKMSLEVVKYIVFHNWWWLGTFNNLRNVIF